MKLRAAVLLAAAGACSHRPPADFAPDPGLVERIREIRISTSPLPLRACPGGTVDASYEALLDDGTRVPFATKYDKKHPPRLHVVFLERTSAEAYSQEDGDWVTSANPLATALTGFRLNATLKAKPAIRGSTVVAPDYGCLPHAFGFTGEGGDAAQAGGNGPDVTVRLGIVRSPFYEKLIVAAVEVGLAPPVYLLADATVIPPSDWLIVQSRGGPGGRGVAGTRGSKGASGTSGCPGSPGGPGGPGGNGGPGGPGGRGGRISVIAPSEEPFLAGLVDARSPGGSGGQGAAGGAGGPGGAGGEARSTDNRSCVQGPDGQPGAKGSAGSDGAQGSPGPRAQVVTLPARDVFGPHTPPELAALIEQSQRRRP